MQYSTLPFTLGPPISERAAIGLLVLATDQTLEHEWRQLIRMPGVAFYESRLHNDAAITPETLKKMEKDIAQAAGLILPTESLDVVAFGCTSGALIIGDDAIARQIARAHPESRATNPLAAAIAALKALAARKVAILTPYVRSLNERLKDYFEARGFQIPRLISYEHANDSEVARIDQQTLKTTLRTMVKDGDADAVFVSCTSLLVTPLIRELEDELGIPITSSNHAMAWHALRLAGIDDAIADQGRLFMV